MNRPDYTPLPWRVDRTWDSEMIVSASGGVMFNDNSNDTLEGVAEYIVHCVNTHDMLLAACEAVRRAESLAGVDKRAFEDAFIEACKLVDRAIERAKEQP